MKSPKSKDIMETTFDGRKHLGQDKKAVSMVLEENLSSTTNRPFVSDNLSATQIYYDIVKSPNEMVMLDNTTSKNLGIGSKMS